MLIIYMQNNADGADCKIMPGWVTQYLSVLKSCIYSIPWWLYLEVGMVVALLESCDD